MMTKRAACLISYECSDEESGYEPDEYGSSCDGVPPMVQLGRLLRASDHYQAGNYDDETFKLLLAPGSSLGGARPKASVRDVGGALYIAKFPKEDDTSSIERWEFIVFQLARRAGCRVAEARLEAVDGRLVLLSKCFDRVGRERVAFSSAMNLLGLADGERSSYAEIADVMQRMGGDPKELFRRLIVNIKINNVDDHLRNHGFLRRKSGWELSPAYDINPMSKFEKAPVLSTAIVPEQFEANVEIALEHAEYFDLDKDRARSIVGQVEAAVSSWRELAQEAGATAREIEEVESAFE